MYLVKPFVRVSRIYIRYQLLTKVLKSKAGIKRRKQALVFVRAPKHFNIGKQKVNSFVFRKTTILDFLDEVVLPRFNVGGSSLYNSVNFCSTKTPLFFIDSIKILMINSIVWP